MALNPLPGVVLHPIGGLAAGSFYAPLKKVSRRGWESYDYSSCNLHMAFIIFFSNSWGFALGE